MKQALFVLGLLVIFAVSGFSQTQQGAWEFSISGAFASLSSTTEISGSGGSRTYTDEPTNYFSLMLRPGFFIIEGLEFEPEIYWGAADGVPPSFSFSGNVSYNYLIPGTRVAPFALAGYGIGNGVPLVERMFTRSSSEFDIGVLNLGAGMKIFVSKQVAFRAEYRYQRFSQENSSGGGYSSYSAKTTSNFHNGFVGVSVFLP